MKLLLPPPPAPTIPVAAPPPTDWVPLDGGSLCPADEYHLIEESPVCDFVIPPPGDELHKYYLYLYAQQRGIPLPPQFASPPTEVPPTPDPLAEPPNAHATETSAPPTSATCPAGQVRLVYRNESPGNTQAGDCVSIDTFCRTLRGAPGQIDASGRCDGNADTGTIRETSYGVRSLLEDMNILR